MARRPATKKDWTIPAKLQPVAAECGFDLDAALASLVGVRANVPANAFTASALGTEREGSGTVIRDGLVLTMGYLVTEAETIWLTTSDGGAVAGHVLGIDGETGFGLVQPLGRLKAPALEFGDPGAMEVGAQAILAAHGGRACAIRTQVVGRQEFAGYWEYLLDDAMFTAPAHPFWGGAALIGQDGRLLGTGSLVLQQADPGGRRVDMNMVVPVELLSPIMDDLMKFGQVNRPARPWLGLYAMEDDEALVVGGLADNGPADKAGLRTGDRILAINGTEVPDLAGLWRAVWASGPAGCSVQVSVGRGSRNTSVMIPSTDRATILKTPRHH